MNDKDLVAYLRANAWEYQISGELILQVASRLESLTIPAGDAIPINGFAYDDGSSFALTGCAGGAHPAGEYSFVTCEHVAADGTLTVHEYLRTSTRVVGSAEETGKDQACIIDWPREVTAVLEGLGNKAIRVREGGGPENLAMSLAVTCAALGRAPDQPSNVIDAIVRCRCGWQGKVSRLVFIEPVGDTKGCPSCHAEFVSA